MGERRLTRILSHLSPSSKFPIREEKHTHGSPPEELEGENTRFSFGSSTHGTRTSLLAVQNSARRGALAFGCNENAEYLHFEKLVENETRPYLPEISLPQASTSESPNEELSLPCDELTTGRCSSKNLILEECRDDTFAMDEEIRKFLPKRGTWSTGLHLATACISQNSCICDIQQENQKSHPKDDGKDIGSKIQNVSLSEIEVNKIDALQTGFDEQNSSRNASQNDTDKPRREPDATAGMESERLERMTVSRNNVMTGERRCFVEDCIFCLIVQGRSPAFKLYEDDMCICILDVHPITHGHSLIIPKAHFHSLELTPPEVAAAMCAIVPFTSVAIMEATNCDSFNLIVNSGKAAGQVVFHTHFHIIPRRQGDNLWRSESVCRPTLCLNNETSSLVQQIRHNLSGKRL